jgi:predicted transcriptional regulator
VSDPIQLAEIFFPSKNAYRKRAAFLAVFFEIKNAQNQRLETTDHIAQKYDLRQSSITKARTKMTRIGLIRKREGFWIFSTVFAKSMDNLAKTIEIYKTAANHKDDRERERMFVEMAKGPSLS